MEVGHVLPEIEMEAMRVHADPEALRAAFLEVANRAFDLFFEKGGDYDKQLPYWHRHPFGDASYGHETFKKSGRAVSVVLGENVTQFEGLDEQIEDVINYAVMWKHWRDITGRSRKLRPSVPLPDEKVKGVTTAPVTEEEVKPLPEPRPGTPLREGDTPPPLRRP